MGKFKIGAWYEFENCKFSILSIDDLNTENSVYYTTDIYNKFGEKFLYFHKDSRIFRDSILIKPIYKNL